MATEQEDPRERVWRLLMEKDHYTDCPREVMDTLDALGVTTDVQVAHSVIDHDETTGVTGWKVLAATRTALIRIAASATRADKQVWTVTRHRDLAEYSVAPKVEADVRPLSDFDRVELIRLGAANAWQSGAKVVQFWKFTLRDGETVELEVDANNRFQSDAVAELSALFARQVTERPS